MEESGASHTVRKTGSVRGEVSGEARAVVRKEEEERRGLGGEEVGF